MKISQIVFVLVNFLTLALAAPLYHNGARATPSLQQSSLERRAAPQNYIVIFQGGASTPDSVMKGLENEMRGIGVKINYEYQTIVKGFSISLDPELLPKLQAMNDKNYPFILEQDKKVQTL